MFKNLKGNIFVKMLGIGVLILVLLIPAFMVRELIHERERVQQSATYEVSSKWGNGQTITGPYVSIPYDRYTTTVKADGTEKIIQTTEWLYFLPEVLRVDGEIAPEKRYRGIYEVVVYESNFELSGKFSPLDVQQFEISEDDVHFEKATLNIGISDLKGIEQQVSLEWNGQQVLFNSGTSSQDIVKSGINAQVNTSIDSTKNYTFKMSIDLKGSQHIYFAPMGKTTDVTLASKWTTPSFTGAYLPDEREVSETGFVAEWNVLHLNRNYPQAWKNGRYRVEKSYFGTDLLLPIDNYQKSYRVARYAILFLVFTFLTFFFVEVLQKVFIHPMQYLLVGLALIIFYTLLLSFSEHIVFNLAYVIAAIMTLGMVTLYTSTVLKSRAIGGLIFGILLILYMFIFAIIQLEDYALLIGSLGLFVVLGIVMYFSRKIDWYNVRLGEQ